MIVATGYAGRPALLTPRIGGHAPTVTTLASNLNDPQGVAIGQGGRTILVVGEDTRLLAWDYANGHLSNRRTIIDGLPAGGHSAKYVVVRNGLVTYNVGSSANRDPADRTTNPQRATIAQVSLNGNGNRTIAVGVRNGEGLSFAPDGSLFAAINQADDQAYPFTDGGRFCLHAVPGAPQVEVEHPVELLVGCVEQDSVLADDAGGDDSDDVVSRSRECVDLAV